MDGLYYLTYIIAIFVVIQWYAANEADKTGGGYKGLLKMSSPEEKAATGGKKQKKRGRYVPSEADWTHRTDE